LKTRIAIAVSFITVLAVAFAHAQSTPLGTVTIPYKFMVAKKEMPAGKYEFVKTVGRESSLLLRSQDTSTSIHVSVIERLAETHPSEEHHARVVFDRVGEQRFLSEFWPANNDDGYLLGITKNEQKHEIVEEK